MEGLPVKTKCDRKIVDGETGGPMTDRQSDCHRLNEAHIHCQFLSMNQNSELVTLGGPIWTATLYLCLLA